MKRIISIILSIAMLLGVVCVYSYAAKEEVVTQLADELYLHKNSFYSESASGDVNENYFVYSPNTSVTPYLAHGNDVAGVASMDRVFRLESEAGNTLIAGVNGDYFITSNGVPIGIEIKDGIIKSSSHSEYPEIGFTEDGEAIIGRSNLNVSFTNTTQDVTFDNIHYNKGLSVDGIPTLYSAAFEDTNRADWTTVNVVVDIKNGEATYNGTISGKVVEVVDSDIAFELQEDQLVLSMYANQDPFILEHMLSFEEGDRIEVTFSMDKSWRNVTQALGGKEMLVESGNAQKFSDNTRAPRTAFGIKSNGDIVIYTCDGRDYGGSKGLSLSELARRMVQLGCKTAVNLDGGASTQVHVVYPGNEEHEQINEDAGSSLRSCGNYICFKNNARPSGKLAKIYAYPQSISVAAESEAKISFKGCDTHWYPMSIDTDELEYDVSNDLGYIEDGKFVSGLSLGSGVITASYGNINTTIAVTVTTDWPEISASCAGGVLIATVEDPLGQGIDKSDMTLTVDGEDYPFVYGNGILTAEFDEPDGYLHHAIITAKNAKGHISRFGLSFTLDSYINEYGESVAVDVDNTQVFADVSSANWAKPYIEYLYRNDIVSGSEKNNKLYYNPSANMTRQEFAKVITSWYGADLDEFESAELDFADNSKIASWAVPYVKAAVELGMMGGKNINGTLKFDPTGSITRQEVMTVIGRIMDDGYQSSNLSEFKDASKVASWALPYVKVLVKQGIITGSNGQLLPNNLVTREQVAKIIFEIN